MRISSEDSQNANARSVKVEAFLWYFCLNLRRNHSHFANHGCQDSHFANDGGRDSHFANHRGSEVGIKNVDFTLWWKGFAKCDSWQLILILRMGSGVDSQFANRSGRGAVMEELERGRGR